MRSFQSISLVCPGHYSRGEGVRYPTVYPGERDERIAVGLDNSMIRAVTQLDDGSCHTPTNCHTPTSIRSSQSQSGHKRRSGRRRRHHMRSPRYYDHRDARYHYNSYHHGDGRYHNDSGHYRSDGQYSSDHDHYSTSDAEYPSHNGPSPPHHPSMEEYESQTLPHPHHVRFANHRHHYEPQARDYYAGDGEYRHIPNSPTRKEFSHQKWYQYERDPHLHNHTHHSTPREVEGQHYSDHYYDHRHRHHSPSVPHRTDSQRFREGSPHRQTPPPSPRDPPNFQPPVPPHAHSCEFDDYDYPSHYQPHQLQKLKEEAQQERNSPYARPRPLNGSSSKEQVSRVTSPYDYPKIRSAGSGASHTPPTTPLVNSNPSSSFSSPQISHSEPQPHPQARLSDQDPPDLQASLSPQQQHSTHANSTSEEHNVTPQLTHQSSTLAPQSTPSNIVTSQAGELTPQPSSSTPQPTSMGLRHANLTIQISPLSEFTRASSPPGSPSPSRRRYPPSPLALHSSSVSEDSPHTSGEVGSGCVAGQMQQQSSEMHYKLHEC